MIVIFSTNIVYPNLTAYIYITNGTTPFMYTKGGLSTEGDLQAALNAMEAELYSEAVASGTVPTPKEAARADGEIYLINNPNAKLLFTTNAADLKTQIDNLVDALFVGHTVSNRNKTKWLWNLVALNAREAVAGE